MRSPSSPPAPSGPCDEAHTPTLTSSLVAPRGAPDDSTLRLVVKDRGPPRKVAVPPQGMTVGASAENDLVLDDPYVSACHARIEPRAGGALVRDRGSKNGTYVNGVRIREAFVRPGSRLLAGRTEIALQEASGDASSSPRGESAARRELIGESRSLRAALATTERIAPHRIPVLLLGETGTGKELFARLLHELGPHAAGRFVALNCGSLPDSLAESELFGHERGAFTGASTRRPGAFREASPGTLFLDEIGELPPGQQAKLLRALETGRVRAVGASEEVPVEVRVVAATHRDLESASQAGRFRLDLYHRLAGVVIPIPPLRQRPGDVLLLARHFLAEAAMATGPRAFSPEAEDALLRHAWPGNVRQLRNAVLRAVALGGPIVTEADLFAAGGGPQLPHAVAEDAAPSSLSLDAGSLPDSSFRPAPPPGGSFHAMEREFLADALARSGGCARRAARAAGLPRSTFYDRARRYGLL